MSKELIISATSLETRLAILEDDHVTEIFIERNKSRGILGNIYKGRVTKVLPGMQAAFVDIGLERHAFLYVSDFFEDHEEYEALFSEAEERVQKLLEEEGVGRDEGRRSRRGRRPRKESGRRRSRTAATSETSEEGETEVLESARPAGEKNETAAPLDSLRDSVLIGGAAAPGRVQSQLLPEVLHWTGSSTALDPSVDSEPEDDTGRGTHILPDRLKTILNFEPESEKSSELDDAEARLGPPDPHARLTTRIEGRPRRGKNGSGRTEGQALIGDLLREGQEILVQVAKEPIGKKGARITSHVALPGRFLVFMPTVDHIGVSRKIASETERLRLKEIILRLRGEFGRGFIVRTAGEDRREEDFRSDMRFLTRLWDDIRSRAEKASSPTLIHEEPNLVQRVVRDHFNEDFRAIRVDDEREYEQVVAFISNFNPDLVNRVRLYNRARPIFDEFGITAEIEKALKHKVWLKNGGYIVINQTEALVAIDVNTGKFVGQTDSLEDTITRTNLDAVYEVVRQIRLRDLGGIIIVDFIDMDERRNRQRVMEALQFELGKDKAPSKILQFNEFGLVAITRRRVKQSLERTLCQPCVYCAGTGTTKSLRTICYSIHQEIRRLLPHLGEGAELLIRCHPDVGKALRNGERDVLQEIEEMTRRVITVKVDPLMHLEQFDLVEA